MPEKSKDTREGADLPAPAPPDSGLPSRPYGSDMSVSHAQLEKIIRRASDLQFRDSSDTGSVLDGAEVVRIGGEVGLDPRYVQQALAEVQAEALVPEMPADSGLAQRLFGSGLVRASRVVTGDQREVEAKLEEHLREKELLKQVRSRAGLSLWEPAGGVVSSMRRAMDVAGHGYELAKARNIQVAIEQLEPGWSLVTLTADLRNTRNQAAGGFYTAVMGSTIGISIAILATGGVGLLPILGAVAVGAAGFGGATWATGATVRKRFARMELALQGLLDRLELGEPLMVTDGSWKVPFFR